MSNLLKKLKISQKKVLKNKKDSLNINSAFGTLTDEEICLVLAIRAKDARIALNKTQEEFSQMANLSAASTYSNFEQKGSMSLVNFVKTIRALGRTEELESLLQPTIEQKIESVKNNKKQRVRRN